MIINVFFSAIVSIITTILSVLPNLPDLPVAITTALNVIPELVRFTSRLVVMFVGRTFYLILLPVLVIFINFNWIYHGTIWVIKKLPIGVK